MIGTSSCSRGWWRSPTSCPFTARRKRRGDLLHRHAGKSRLLLIHGEAIPCLVVLHVPVDVHNAVGFLENLPDLPGHLDLPPVIGTVDFRHQRLQNRRPGRDLDHLDPGAMFRRDGVDHRPDPFRDVVALRLPIPFRNQIHLDVRLVGLLTQEIVPHQAVEVVGGGSTDVHLVIHHLRDRGDGVADLPGNRGGLLQGRALGHVDHHLELALVVEGKHLHLHDLEREKGQRTQEQENDEEKEAIAPRRPVKEAVHRSPVEPRGPSFLAAVGLALPAKGAGRPPRA